MRGQSYDNNANMKGKIIVSKKTNFFINPTAVYVLCSSHSLYLVIIDSAKAFLKITNFFTLIPEIYVFLPHQLIIGKF